MGNCKKKKCTWFSRHVQMFLLKVLEFMAVLKVSVPFFRLEELYYEPLKTGNAFSSNYTEYKSNGDRNKTQSLEGYL